MESQNRSTSSSYSLNPESTNSNPATVNKIRNHNESIETGQLLEDSLVLKTNKVITASSFIQIPNKEVERVEINNSEFDSFDCDVPILYLEAFKPIPIISFGTTYSSAQIKRNFYIQNDNPYAFILKTSLTNLENHGFELDLTELDEKEIKATILNNFEGEDGKLCMLELEPLVKALITIKWAPMEPGAIGFVMSFRALNMNQDFKVKFHGQTVYKPASFKSVKRTPKAGSSRTPISNPNHYKRAPSPICENQGLSELSRKKPKEDVPEPIDLGWSTEMNKTFSNWLTLELVPFYLNHLPQAPPGTPGYTTLKIQTLHIIDSSQSVLLSSKYNEPIARLSQQFGGGAISIKEDVDLTLDYEIKRELIKNLAYFNPVWFGLALEVVFDRKGAFGRPLTSDGYFIAIEELLFGFLSEPTEFHNLAQSVLITCCKVVLFLDLARQANLIPAQPNLFNLSTFTKSTCSLFRSILRILIVQSDLDKGKLDYLIKDLVSVQDEAGNYDFRVKDLAKDLRDGVKIYHMVSNIFGVEPKDCNYKPISLDDKVKNLELAFDVLDNNGIPTTRLIGGPTRPKDIVIGHRIKTLGLLWTLMLRRKLSTLINPEFFKSQIAMLHLEFYKRNGRPLVDLATENAYFASTLLSGLLTWCATVCNLYGIYVVNFTSSFSDGQALCYLVAHYFPSIIDPSQIQGPPRNVEPSYEKGVMESNWLVFSPIKKRKVNPVRAAVIHNFDLFKSVVHLVGNIPPFSTFRVDGAIDERVVVTYVALLANRIAYLSQLSRTATKIQRWWKSFTEFNNETKAQAKLEAIRNNSANIIARAFNRFISSIETQNAMDRFSSYQFAASITQRHVRAMNEKRKYQCLMKTTTIIQSFRRTKAQKETYIQAYAQLLSIQALCQARLARERFRYLSIQHTSAKIVQSYYRGYFCRSSYLNSIMSSKVIQTRLRALNQSKELVEQYKLVVKAARVVQSYYRKKKQTELEHMARENASIRIQSLIRGHQARFRFSFLLQTTHAITAIQSKYRMRSARINYSIVKIRSETVQKLRRQCIETRIATTKFSGLKRVALFVQDRFRFNQYMARLKLETGAVTIIQSAFRMLAEKADFDLVKKEANIIHNIRKELLHTRRINTQFTLLKRTALFVQDKFRFKQHMSKLKLETNAVTIVQSTFRMAVEKASFSLIRKEAISIQNNRKELLHTRHTNVKFALLRSIVLLIQARFRFKRHITRVRLEIAAATIIQSLCRMAVDRTEYEADKDGAIQVQMARREVLRTRQVENNFKVLKRATLFVQDRFRFQQHMVQLHYTRTLAATKIQKVVRRAIIQYHYLLEKWAGAIVWQRRKAVLHGRYIQHQYVIQKKAATTIQNHVRQLLEEKQAKQQRSEASIVIQSYWRRYCAQNKLEILKVEHYNATKVQAFLKMSVVQINMYRAREACEVIGTRRIASLAGREGYDSYRMTQSAAITFQRKLRHLWCLRSWHKEKEAACTLIQTIWRGILARRVLSQLKTRNESSILIQSKVRGFFQFTQYQQTRSFIRVIQSFRIELMETLKIKGDFIELKDKVRLIQQRFRFKQYYKHLCETKAKAAIKIQAIWRAYCAKNVLIHLKRTYAVTVLTKYYRMKVLRSAYLETKVATNLIHQAFKEKNLTFKASESYRKLQDAALLTQFIYQHFQGCKSVKLEYENKKHTAITIQRALRRYWEYEKLKAKSAITIQSAWRMARQRNIFEEEWKLHKSAQIIQSQLKMVYFRSNFLKKIQVSNAIRYYRQEKIETKRVKTEFEDAKSAAQFIQTMSRHSRECVKQREMFTLEASAITKIQSAYRMAVSFHQLRHFKNAAEIVQENRRQTMTTREIKKDYLELKHNSIVVVNTYIHHKQCAEIHNKFRIRKHSAMLIQRKLREYWCKKDTEYKASTTLQAYCLTYLARKHYLIELNRHNQAIKLQALFRMVLALNKLGDLIQASDAVTNRRRALVKARIECEEYQKVRDATVTFQYIRKDHVLTERFKFDHLALKKASTIIQKAYRLRVQARIHAAKIIQAKWRSYLVITQAKHLLANKKYIRAMWRRSINITICANVLIKYQEQVTYAMDCNNFRLMENSLRVWRSKCGERLEYLKQEHIARQQDQAASFLQAACRAYLARRKLQASFQVASAMQRLWRGHVVRRRNGPLVKRMRARVIKANSEAKPHMILSHRTTLALNVLSTSKSLTQIISACEHLVVVTQLSHTCRDRLLGQYHVIQVILELMRSCNRSQPHQQILKHSVLILENLSRDPEIAPQLLTSAKEVDDILVTLLAHKDLMHVASSLLVTLFNLLNHPPTFNIITTTPQAETHLKMIRAGLNRKKRLTQSRPIMFNRPPINNKKVVDKAIYSVGLYGMASSQEFDQVELVETLLASFV